MIEPPGGPALLDAARKTLLEELLPALPPDKHYAALMVANAMAIASRTARRDRAGDERIEARVRSLTGSGDGDPWRAFAAAIRAGRFRRGTPERAEAYALLRGYAEARCALSSPKALKRTG
ncbi:MAG: hypothetical protein JOZ42_13310 [Acetobacteraceae bacterium]|nr:hypothetical protein [Acetobacteraceae bacterium]